MSQLLYLIFFLSFLWIVVALRVTHDTNRRRHLVTILIFYVLAVHGLLAAERRDAWPFSTHGVFLESGDERRPFSNVAFFGVDRTGQEHRIDPNSWSPVHVRTLAVWWLMNFDRLDSEDQRRVMRFLLTKAEEARRVVGSGGRIGPSRFLGIAAAPFWYSVDLTPPPSNDPYVGLRAYIVTRIPGEKFRTGAESRHVIAEIAR
ncbi:MAG: hypothetical protein M3041_10195 [Acidobacteriota bacterium]|nr:hypothetical protein [Acidobacteriota bacterium]